MLPSLRRPITDSPQVARESQTHSSVLSRGEMRFEHQGLMLVRYWWAVVFDDEPVVTNFDEVVAVALRS
jgi:hypothetical protein